MSAPAFAWAFEKGHELGLTSSQLLLLLYMADQANGQGWFYTGLPRIAKYSRLCVRTIRDLIPELMKLELIRAEYRPGKSTIYHVLRQPQGEAATAAQASAARQANGATPAATAVANGTHPGNPAPAPRQSTTLTPAATAHDPYLPKKSTLKSEAKASSDGKKEGGTPPSAPPAPAPPPQTTTTTRSDAYRRPGEEPPTDTFNSYLEAPAPTKALPCDVEQDVIRSDVPDPDGPPPPGAFKALLASIASGFQNNYPPRLTDLSRDEQAASCTEKPRPKTYPLNANQLAQARKQAGIRATVDA